MVKPTKNSDPFSCQIKSSPISSGKPGFTELFSGIDVDTDSANQVIKSTLRTESLLELAQLIKVDYDFIQSLRQIYHNIRFSIDLENCLLIRSVNHQVWEYIHIVKDFRFEENAQWIEISGNQFNSIEELLNMPKEALGYFPTSEFNNQLLDDLLMSKSSYFEHFVHNKGGAIFSASKDSAYNQCDMCFLSHVSAIISYCVEKEISNSFLAHVYQNLGSATTLHYQAKGNKTAKMLIPAIYMDVATGLPNQRGFLRILRQAVESKVEGIQVVVLSIDNLNYYSNLFEDEIQQRFLQQLVKIIREVICNDTFSYLGGSNFAYFVSSQTIEQTVQVIEKVIAAFINDVQVADYRANFNMTSGYSSLLSEVLAAAPSIDKVPDMLLNFAEIALYQAEKLHGIKLLGYQAGMEDELKLQIDLMRGLQQAINKDEFVLFFQPIASYRQIDDKQFKYYEALLRWQHPEYGLVAPDKFIEIAEKSGEIIPLGYWVLEKVCQYLSQVSLPHELKVSVNLSPIQLRTVDLVETIISIVERYNIPACCIVFEITETAAMQNPELSKVKFKQMRAYGFQLAVDDFGTGHSALSYLLEFSLDVLKIDKSFIDNTLENDRYAVIAESMIVLAHQLSMLVVCEGIETEEQLLMVKSWHADLIQGYYISKPRPWEEFCLNTVMKHSR